MSVVPLQDALATYDCKVEGCDGEARQNMGPYAYLCDYHREEKARHIGFENKDRAADAGRRGGEARSAKFDAIRAVGFEKKARTLVDIGKRVDKAVASYRPAKEELEAAMRAWQDALRQIAEGGDE